jgi:hypothetical protein
MDYHSIVSLIVVVLTIVAYVPYVLDIFKGKTKPHSLTWFTVSLIAFIAFGLQVEGGAGVGAWPMLFVALVCVLVFILSLWRGVRDITRSDVILTLASLVAVYLWVVVEQPIISVLLITIAEVLAFVPTIRKSWNAPHTETLSLYQISAVRHGLATIAVEQMNILTVLYPAAWALTNVVIVIILVLRREKLKR